MVGSLRKYAAQRGCALSAVQKAIARKRLNEAVVREGDKVIGLDFEIADREWLANTQALKGPRPVPRPSIPVVDSNRFTAFRCQGLVVFGFITGDEADFDHDYVYPMTPEAARIVGQGLIDAANRKGDDLRAS